MRSKFQTLFLAPVVMAAAALLAGTASAETLLNVPFNFSAAGKQCPAGVYSVTRDRVGTLVTLRSKTGSQSFTWIASPGNPSPADARIVLRFDTEGSSHMLQSVQYGSMITSRLDSKTKPDEYVPTRIVLGQ